MMRRLAPSNGRSPQASDERAVSFTLGYVLTVGLAVIIIGAMSVTVGQVVADERIQTIRAEAEVVGDETAAGFMAADRLIQRGTDSNVSIGLRLPPRLAGEAYTISVRANATEAAVIISTQTPSVTVVTPMVNRTPIEETTIAGADIRVVYRAGGRLTLEKGDA